MAVIPLVLEGEGATVVETREAFKAREEFSGNFILILKLDRAQLVEATQDSNVTYDLRVGKEYRDHLARDAKGLPDNGVITLPPGAAIIVETEEHLALPRSMFGTIVPKVSLLMKGISNTSSKVDPGYDGPLLVTVFNLGKRTVTLKRGERFCSLCLLEVRGKARQYLKGAQRIPAPYPQGYREWISDWIDRNPTMVASIVAAIISAIVSYLLGLASR